MTLVSRGASGLRDRADRTAEPQWVVELDRSGGFRFVGVPPADDFSTPGVLGLTPEQVFPPPVADELVSALVSAVRTGVPVEARLPLPGQDLARPVLLMPVVGPGSTITRVVMVEGMASSGLSEPSFAGFVPALGQSVTVDHADILDAQSDLVARFLPDTTILYANAAYRRAFRRSGQEPEGRRWIELLPAGERDAVLHSLAHLRPTAPRVMWKREEKSEFGQTITREWVNEGIFDRAGSLVEIQSIGRDVTERLMTERLLRESEERYRKLVDNAPDAIWIVQEGTICFANPAAFNLFGADEPEALINTRFAALADDPAEEAVLRDRLRALISGATDRLDLELRVRRLDAVIIDVAMTACSIVHEGRPGVQFAARDVTERKALQRQFEHLALHDPLTGLANRILFRRELELACARARRQSTHVVVLCLDLDGFKAVNDRFGHLAGDELLVQIAQRLRAHVRETDVLARLGGDEFSLIVADLSGHDQAAQVAARISTLFERPFLLEGHSLTVGCSIGVTSYPDDDSGLEQLMAHADAAMYAAKRSRRHAWRRYRP